MISIEEDSCKSETNDLENFIQERTEQYSKLLETELNNFRINYYEKKV
jgi:hypothetical protein